MDKSDYKDDTHKSWNSKAILKVRTLKKKRIAMKLWFREEDSDAEIIAEDIDDENAVIIRDDQIENVGEVEVVEDRVGDEDGLRLADNNQVSVDEVQFIFSSSLTA